MLETLSLILLLSGPAAAEATEAQGLTGQDLLQYCEAFVRDGSVTPNSMACGYYVKGFADAMRVYDVFLATVRTFDNFQHKKIMASLGGLSKEELQALATGSSSEMLAKVVADLSKLQTEAMARQGTTTARVSSLPREQLEAMEARLACFPEGVSGEQLIRVVAKYLQDHPEELHKSGDTLVLGALEKAFPCRR